MTSGTWELDADKYGPGYILKFRMTNGHVVTFPLIADHPIVLGMKSTERMTKEEPAQ